ncbi:triphosphoribosyl-dephospho-CoA synthase MdcB [Mitsuaria sp. GD03876]|uniref:triphosphoribosyl-dephospho-CoA synthase MdcB n=1 Tax=Mitsuaria sp. GD03876 TaxID=2975399 RepID=UPI0024496243|nr:triphosphoribosyl-dephospho-CoA synthase MdcB [Mitsuaria sp. GD03876]MDH0867329.1 triphosphoribosyl-dephospho-CoA synthase MdcB [Mitsuaria sp. GD03876]
MNNAAVASRSMTPSATDIGRAAAVALHDELVLSPKPGLVTLTSTGSHRDMDARTFIRSISSLRGYFVRIAHLGMGDAAFPALERAGIEAEARMLEATGGVNTHRGAIFQLGLLCAAAGAVVASGRTMTPAAIRSALIAHWGEALRHRAQRPSTLPGGIAARRLGLRSASEEAALGFPAVFEVGVPAMRAAIARGLTRERAQLDTLFHLMAALDDSNLAHRGGLEGLRFAQRAAKAFLEGGGAAHPAAIHRAEAIARDFEARRLSPGGSADMLAAVCWMQRLGAIEMNSDGTAEARAPAPAPASASAFASASAPASASASASA